MQKQLHSIFFKCMNRFSNIIYISKDALKCLFFDIFYDFYYFETYTILYIIQMYNNTKNNDTCNICALKCFIDAIFSSYCERKCKNNSIVVCRCMNRPFGYHIHFKRLFEVYILTTIFLY